MTKHSIMHFVYNMHRVYVVFHLVCVVPSDCFFCMHIGLVFLTVTHVLLLLLFNIVSCVYMCVLNMC